MDVCRFDFFDLGLGSECYVKCSDFDRVTAERDALQQLLNARDEEIDRLRDQIWECISGQPMLTKDLAEAEKALEIKP